MLGAESGLAEADVDTTDERVLAEFLDQHGNTLIVIRSGRPEIQGVV